MSFDPAALIALGRRVVEVEGRAVSAASDRLDDRFARAVRLLADVSGRVIVSGVGKSGLIARKLAATLTSTGTVATYLHPVVRAYRDGDLVATHHLAENLENQWNLPAVHQQPLALFLKSVLADA